MPTSGDIEGCTTHQTRFTTPSNHRYLDTSSFAPLERASTTIRRITGPLTRAGPKLAATTPGRCRREFGQLHRPQQDTSSRRKVAVKCASQLSLPFQARGALVLGQCPPLPEEQRGQRRRRTKEERPDTKSRRRDTKPAARQSLPRRQLLASLPRRVLRDPCGPVSRAPWPRNIERSCGAKQEAPQGPLQ
jgi:hypothetical protein